MRLVNLYFRAYHPGGAISALLRVVAAATILLKIRLRLKKYKKSSTFVNFLFFIIGKVKVFLQKNACSLLYPKRNTWHVRLRTYRREGHALRNFSLPSVALIYLLLLLLPPFQDVSSLVIDPLVLLLWGLFRGGGGRFRHLLSVHGRRRRLGPCVLQHGLSGATPVTL